MGQIKRIIRYLICLPIVFYQYFISPLINPCCRFYPSCSQYALDAIDELGITRGLWKTLGRIIRCHPWSSSGGYDPVLPNKENL